MTEPLNVDPSRLGAAGVTLRGLGLPQPPAPVAATGTDPVSAAINETLPVIESPVIHGLPAADAALSRTAAKIAGAATTYTETDQLLGERLGRQQFVRAVGAPSAGAIAGSSVAGARADQSAAGDQDEPPPASDPIQRPDDVGATPRSGLEMASQLSQFAAVGGMAGTTAQSVVQSVQGAIGNVPASAQSPAPTDQPGSADESADPAQDRAEQQPQADEEGAAAGDNASEGIPMPIAANVTQTPQPVLAHPSAGPSTVEP